MRRSSWSIVLAKVRNKLASWKGKYFSLGGRVILFYLMLNVPLFSFSFYKAPKVVIQEFIKIQLEFLWKGEENIRRINLGGVVYNLFVEGGERA